MANLLSSCNFSDPLVALHSWTRHAFLASEAQDHSLVLRATEEALDLADSPEDPAMLARIASSEAAHRKRTAKELLSYAASLRGQSLLLNMAGKMAIRRQALQSFLDSAL